MPQPRRDARLTRRRRRLLAIHERRLTLRSSDEAMRVKTNRNFHDAIMRASGNGRLTDAIYHSGQFYFNAPRRATTGEELTLGNADHALIVAAILESMTALPGTGNACTIQWQSLRDSGRLNGLAEPVRAQRA